MNPTIVKPNSPSRLWRATRRKRPHYPSFPVGEGHEVERPECGRNIELLTPESKKRGRKVMQGKFLLERPIPKPTRSKYAPHIGKKQLARS
jgi:hypothetical protein